MKIQKKEVAILLTFVLMLGCLCNPARIRAADGDNSGDTSTEGTQTPGADDQEHKYGNKIEVSKGSLANLKVDGSFNVTVHIYDIEKFAGLEGTLEYDKEVFEIKDPLTVSKYTSSKNGEVKWKATVEADTNKLQIKSDTDPDVELTDSNLNMAQGDGLHLTIPFHVKKEVTDHTIRLKDVKIHTDADWTKEDSSIAIENNNIAPVTVRTRELTLKLSDANGSERVLIPVQAEKNDGVTEFTISVSYDTDKLEFDPSSYSIVKEGAEEKLSVRELKFEDKAVSLKFISMGTWSNTGKTFFNLAFKVKTPVTADEKTEVALKVTYVKGDDSTPFNLSSDDKCTVTLQPLKFTLGKVYTENGEPNLMDALWVLQYIQGKRTLTEAQKKAADVDQDGAVTLLDVVRIIQKYNGIKSF